MAAAVELARSARGSEAGERGDGLMFSAGHARGCWSNAGRAGSPRKPIFADQADPLHELFEIDGLDDVRAAAMPVHGVYLPLLGGGGQVFFWFLCFCWVCLV